MIKSLKETWDRWSTTGLKLPFVHDPEANAPSVTLLTYYLSLIALFASLLALHIKLDLWPATSAVIVVFILSFVFYRIRKLDKFKIDLDDQTIELDAQDDPPPKP